VTRSKTANARTSGKNQTTAKAIAARDEVIMKNPNGSRFIKF
jgi:hypothetical protein